MTTLIKFENLEKFVVFLFELKLGQCFNNFWFPFLHKSFLLPPVLSVNIVFKVAMDYR